MPPSVGSASTCISTIRVQIEDSLVMSVSRHRFLPTDKLCEIFTLPAIRRAVQELTCGPDDRIKLADTIYNDGKRVFAMLIYNWWENCIIDFRKHEVLDKQLPLSEESAEEITGHAIGHRLATDSQWIFLPYVFPEHMWECRLNIDKRYILPFVGAAEQVGTGAFGDVEKISVSPSQHNFPAKEAVELHVVRKKLRVRGLMEDFDREDKCLRLLNQLKHPNIIPLWGSYTHGEERNFLFPYIGMDLDKFLQAEHRHKMFQWDFTFYSALTGLASALSKTHHLHLNEYEHDVDFEAIGYHHDLRPPNVLVSHDSFILSDFGLGSLKDLAALSHTPYKSISGDYIAPECTDRDENPLTVNRAIDVWAFGCLIAEVVTYMLKKADGVQEFRKRRLTTGRIHQFKDSGFYQAHGEVKEEVRYWFDELRHEVSQSDLITRLLALALDALQADPRSRPDMGTVYQILAALSLKKYFDAVQDQFRRIRGADDPSALPKQHLQSLDIAQRQFDIWGQVLGLYHTGIPRRFHESLEGSVKVMTKLLHILMQQADNRTLEDTSVLDPLQQIKQSIEELWGLLPDSLRLLANRKWHREVNDDGVLEQIVQYYMPQVTSNADSNPLASEFEAAAQTFKKAIRDSVLPKDLLNAKPVKDVYDVMDNTLAAKQLHNLPKMRPYLERLGDHAGIIKNRPGENIDVLELPWGPLTLPLQCSNTFDKAHNSITNTVANIGRTLPDWSATGPVLKSPDRESMVLLFDDILNFYRVTLGPFSHPGLIYNFDRLWPRQSALVSEVSGHIGRLTQLMRTEIRLEHIQREHELRENAHGMFKKQAIEDRREEFDRIRISLSPHNYENALYCIRGSVCLETETWLFSCEAYTRWLNGLQERSRILWLQGIPGAGKTFLAGTVVGHLRSTQTTAFAFLTYEDERTSALSIMHSLIFQLAGKDDDFVAIVCEMDHERLQSDLTTATNLLSSLIHFAGPVCLVIDGLDEIDNEERYRLVTKLLTLVEVCENLRIILSSRPETDLVRVLSNVVVTIRIDDHNASSIDRYITQRVQSIFDDNKGFPRENVVMRHLSESLASRSSGMFLYARHVMDMVACAHDLSEIEDEIHVLPQGLDAAYHRIILRLSNHKDKHEADQARRLLGWVACSPVPLTIEEAQQALMLQPHNRGQVFRVMAKLNVVNLLGSIVETSDGYIRFVHFTAREYISNAHLGKPFVDTNQATLDLAMRCISYLCQDHHDPTLSSEHCSENVRSGQYSFHAFSARMWFELSCQYIRSTEPSNLPAKFVDSIQKLWISRNIHSIRMTDNAGSKGGTEDDSQMDIDDEPGNEIKSESEYEFVEQRNDDNNYEGDESGFEAMFDGIKETQPFLHDVLCRVSRFRKSSSFCVTGTRNQDPCKDEHDPLSTTDMSQRIRQAFDDVLCSAPVGWVGFDKPGCHEV